jgi:hypothetical protein
VVSTILSIPLTTPTVACSSIASSADIGLLADATGVLLDEAPAASNSSIDTSSSSVLTSALASFSPEEALKRASVSMEPISAELIYAAKSSAPEAVSATPAPTLSLSTAPEGSLLDDELSRSSYKRKKKRKTMRAPFCQKAKPNNQMHTGISIGTRLDVSALCLDCHKTKNYINIMRKAYQLTNGEARTRTLTLFSE